MADMSPRDRAHKNYSIFTVAIGRAKAGDIAKELGWADSKLSELRTQKAEDVLAICAHLGLKLVPSERVTIKPVVLDALIDSHQTLVNRAPHLLYLEDDE